MQCPYRLSLTGSLFLCSPLMVLAWAVGWGLFESHMLSQPRTGEAITLGNVSLVYGNLEKSKQAIVFYQEAITIYEEIFENNQLLTQDV